MNITLNPLTSDDAAMVFSWRNDPFIASLGSLQKTVTWEEHSNWIAQVLKNPLRKAFIISVDGIPAGQIRFDKTEADENKCIISVYLIKEFTSKGLGVKVIEEGCELIANTWSTLTEIEAYVLRTNTKGQQAFKNAGFAYMHTLSSDTELAFTYKLALPVPHNKNTFDESEAAAVAETVSSGYWAQGEKTRELEQALCEHTGRKFAIAVGSGLSALRIALIALKIKTGDEVIIPAYSCVAICNAVLSVGATPVIADIDNTLNIDPEKVKLRVNANTKAIIAIHTFGMQANIAALKANKIPVIEDCAHALQSSPENTHFGTTADIAICSFYATKLIGGGEGGAVLTNTEATAQVAYDYRDYSDKMPSGLRLNEKISDLHASLTLTQLQKLPYFIRRRKNIAALYTELLTPLAIENDLFDLPPLSAERIWYRYTLQFRSHTAEQIIGKLKEKGIQAEKPVENWMSEQQTSVNSHSALAYDHIVSLPMYPTLTVVQQKKIVSHLKHILTISA